jgi:hypothetical protein
MYLIQIVIIIFLSAVSIPSFAQSVADACGEVVTLKTHGNTTMRYALSQPKGTPAQGGSIALVLLAGGGGHADLDDKGCPRALVGNSLIRSIPLFNGLGFVTALVDAPSDHPGDDGLAGFRLAPEHAEDLGKVISDLRARTKGAVWVAGTSRGAISAVNAAARLSGPSAPDGVVLTSAVTVGSQSNIRPWLYQTVFEAKLEGIRLPVLVVGHAADKCLRAPASNMERITARTNGAREQVVTVTGGPGYDGAVSIEACIGSSPHGFIEQQAEVAAGIARFIRGGSY